MHYISTRGAMDPVGFTDVLLSGLAPDGGLAVPAELPTISAARLEQWRPLDYPALATEVIGLFATDIDREDLESMTAAAYGPARFPAPVVPLTRLDEVADGLVLVGLSQGPTLAFKDLAMQFLGQAIPHVLAAQGRVLNILGATSGDTGSAAEHALRGHEGVSVFMLSPAGRMSPVQRAQMYSLQDANIHNIAVEGVFDDCQNLVKALSNDAAFKAEHHLGAVNSINIGRIAAQAVYYVWAWLRITDEVEEGRRASQVVDVCVPSGNFGNIYAGFLARSMGVPLRRLILATNENNVLEEFFSTGVYAPRSAQETLATSSPSMDISKASNLERFVWALLGPQAFVERWKELESTGRLDLSDYREQMRDDGFRAGASSHADRLAAIRLVHERSGVLIDPHTADGVTVALQHLERGDGVPMLVMETAKAAKFPQTVAEALGGEQPEDPALTELLSLPQRVETIENAQEPLRALITERAVRA